MRLRVPALLLSLAACHSPKPAESPADETPVAEPEPATDGVALLPAPSRKGLLAVANRGTAHFTILFAGKQVQVPEGDSTNVIVDGQILQLVVVPAEDILGAGAPPVDDATLLKKHVEWEVGFLSHEVGKTLHPKTEDYRTPSGARCLRWEIAIPPEEGENPAEAVRANLFLSTALAGHVVVLGSPVAGKDDPAAVRARLTAVMDTFSPSAAFLDPKKVREELAKEKPAGRR